MIPATRRPSRSPTSCSTSSRRSRGVSLPFPLFVFPPPPAYKGFRVRVSSRCRGELVARERCTALEAANLADRCAARLEDFVFVCGRTCVRPVLLPGRRVFFLFVHRLSAAALRVLRYVRAHVCEAHAQSPRTAAAWLPRSRSSRAGTVFVSRTRPRTWMSRRSYQWLLALASQARFRSASRARVDAALVACWSLL